MNLIYRGSPPPGKAIIGENHNNGSGEFRIGIKMVRPGFGMYYPFSTGTSVKGASNGFKVYGRAGDYRIDRLEVLVSSRGQRARE